MATTNNSNKLSISDILGRKLAPIVKPGKYENVQIKEMKLYPVTETNKQEFIRFTFQTEDGREISDNRFAQGLQIMISHLREQLDLQDVEIDPNELLEPGKHKFTIWVDKTTIIANNGNPTRVTNIHFLEPLKATEETKDNPTEIEDEGEEMPE